MYEEGVLRTKAVAGAGTEMVKDCFIARNDDKRNEIEQTQPGRQDIGENTE